MPIWLAILMWLLAFVSGFALGYAWLRGRIRERDLLPKKNWEPPYPWPRKQ